MAYELPEHLIPVFNGHFEKAMTLSEGLIILSDTKHPSIGFWEKRKSKKAIAHYKKCLELIPLHWQTKWFLAKLYQALGEKQEAFQLFSEAAALEKSNIDVAREASIAAIDVGEVELAINYSSHAINLQPDNSGLMCNHAINLMISGFDEEAAHWINKAIEIDPENSINKSAYRLIMSVKNGEQKRPQYDEL